MVSAKHVNLLLIFFTAITILSLWSLYIYRYAPIIVVVALGLIYIASKKITFDSEKISSTAIGIALLVAVLAAYPFFLNNFVDASADSAAHISSLAIGSTMPETYAPFSNLEYRYQIGFPLLAKLFIDLLPFVSSNFLVWFLGVIFAFLSAVLIYLISKEIFKSEKAGLIGLALFVGSKIVFQNMYWGQYTFMLASVFFLATFLAFYKKSKLAYLFFPMIIVSHPGVAFYSFIFFALWLIFFRDQKRITKLVLSGLFVLPSFFISYIHFLNNLGAEETIAITAEKIVANTIIFPLWVGLLIFIFVLIYLILNVLKVKQFMPSDKDEVRLAGFLLSVFVASFLFYVFFSSSGRIIGGRIIELSMFSGLFISVLVVNKFISSGLKISKFKIQFNHILVLIMLISLFLFFTSGQLDTLRNGSKITPEGVDFAYAFKEFDSSYEKTFFLIPGHGKIAEISQKIPYDVMSSWYLSYDKRIAADDPFYLELIERHEFAEKTREEKCISCLKQIDFYYLVSKEDYFSNELGLKKVFEFREYMVFSK
ncbi:MAG: hypothetical protein NUV57_06260 [archaeon]|nr:hypothetical protein [archaeon]